MSGNNTFKTHDIHLAVYLKTQGAELREIQPLRAHECIFVFEPVSQDLLNQWLSTEAVAPVRLTINEYRHLVRTSRAYRDMFLRSGVRND